MPGADSQKAPRSAPAGRATVISRHLVAAPTAAVASAAAPPRVLIEFYFDTSSPWTYMAFSRIREVCSRTGAELSLKPFLVGGVFNVANKSLYASRDRLMAMTDASKPAAQREGPSAKELWSSRDMLAWADYLGLDIKTMGARFNARTKSGAPGHPISAVKMLRGALVAQEEGEDALVRFAFASFDAYWTTLRDVSDDQVIRELHGEAALRMPVDDFMRRLDAEEIKARLRANTEEVLRLGGFGSPVIYVSRPDQPEDFEPQMHWGNDRMELVEAAVLRAKGRPWRYHDTCGVPVAWPGPRNRPRGGWASLTTGEGS
mmetsp:Transcript_30950/g.92047  ORF Transcript_30950/g.92047 Transcript_30950/m.92047 type:complete len:317 (+) Transcript_30950:23-973(+)